MPDLQTLLESASARHRHLCPRQVLGVRIGLAGVSALGLAGPHQGKRLLVIMETDGCFGDGLEVATGCTMGHRTLRLADYGKIGATFVDVLNEVAVRVWPRPDIRERACLYAPEETRHYFAQLVGYQRMPVAELLLIRPVRLTTPISRIVSRPGIRVNCGLCGEEIINEREQWQGAMALCQSCAGRGYYLTEAEEAATLDANLRP